MTDRAPYIGELRHRVTVERQDIVTVEGGSFRRSWSPITRAWAAITLKTSAAAVQAQRAIRRDLYDITMRGLPDVDEAARIRFGSRVFMVNGHRALDERGRFIIFSCEEVTAK